MSSAHIPVRPTYSTYSPLQNAPRPKARERTPPMENMDPDMKRVIDNENTFKAAKTQHVQTKEEQTAVLEDKTGISWIMIIFAVIIVALVCAIMWLVLRHDKKEESELKHQLMPRRVQFADPVVQPAPLPRRKVAERVFNPAAKKPAKPVVSEPAAVKPVAEDESVAEEQDAVELVVNNPVKEIVMKKASGSTLFDPVIEAATEGELFEILEGDNRKFAKKKKIPKKKTSPEAAVEDEMAEDYYNEIQDSDEEDYDPEE